MTKGGFSTRVVADGDDQVGALDRLVHVVALGERGGAHVELGAAGHRALAHLRREIGNARSQRRTAPRSAVSVAGEAAAPSITSGRLAVDDHGGGAIEHLGAGDRQLERVRRHRGGLARTSSAAMSSGSSRCTGPGRSSCATRKASRTRVGIAPVETIWCASLVSGFMAATTSTIWKRAWRALPNGLLAGDHDHRHRAEMGVGRAGREVQRAGSERGDAHAGLAGEPASRWRP